MRKHRKKDQAERTLATVPAGHASPVGHDRAHENHRPVSKNARSRPFVENRNASIEAYAKFAATAGVDLYDGEPLEVFDRVVKIDNALLRKEAMLLRKELLTTKLGGGVS